MKNILHLLMLLSSIISFAQPQGINYQGVARDASGEVLLNQNISLRLSILDSSSSGASVFMETQIATTNNSGLFNLSIGTGTILSGVFANIPWGQGDKWLKIEMDAAGGTNFQLIGTSQFLSVPFALHSASANVANGLTANSSFSTFTMMSSFTFTLRSYWTAMNYCNNLVEGGYSDWRLPSLDEVNKYVELNGLPATLVSWTNSHFNNGSTAMYFTVNFGGGNGETRGLRGDSDSFYVTCVR